MQRERALQIRTPSGWKVAGKLLSIRGEWSFYREVRKSAHAFHTFDAWSIQACVLPVLEKDGVRWIYQYEWDAQGHAGQMTRISVRDFKDKSVERDFGEGKQLYVSTKYFQPVQIPRVWKWINSVELVA